MSANGELHFTLLEKVDRNGETYLFAGVKIFNSVLFIRKDIAVHGRPQRWKAILKPYEKPSGQADDIAWDELEHLGNKD